MDLDTKYYVSQWVSKPDNGVYHNRGVTPGSRDHSSKEREQKREKYR